MSNKEIAQKAIAIKALQEKFKPQRESLVEFMRYMWETEKKQEFDDNWHYYLIEEKLKKLLDGEITRLIINVPPRSGKTLMITELFPVWAMGNKPGTQFISTGYSTSLTREFSQHARDWYLSDSYKNVFPMRKEMREDQNTKEYWKTDDESSYYATGAGGTITGRGCDVFIIDDPIKPDEADKSDVVREGINNWYLNTVPSRLNNPKKGGIIIIQQRTHEDDLTGFLKNRMEKGLEKWEEVVIPAIAEVKDDYRDKGESISTKRVPIEVLEDMRKNNPIVFSTQYQQDPVNKDTQEFHEEWYRYFDDAPEAGRIFAMLDPANKTKSSNDESTIIVGRVINDSVYVEEIVGGRFSQPALEDKCIYVARKWNPEKFGVEAYAAQVWVGHSLRNRFKEAGLFTQIEEITQKGSKEEKIRSIINPIRSGKLYFKRGIDNLDTLELQMKKFPRGAHDDYVDCLQMLWFLSSTQPNIDISRNEIPTLEYNEYGQPVYNSNSNNYI